MAKENNKRQTETKAPKTEKPQNRTAKPSGSFFSKLIANIGGAFIAVIFIMIVFRHNEPDPQNPDKEPINHGYDWMLNTMLKGSLEAIDQYPDLTTEQRYELKWGGGEITYVFEIKRQTPDSAVILFPPKAYMEERGAKSMQQRPWLTYFLYPRKVIYEDDKDRLPLYDEADYIVSIEGWGFDKLSEPIVEPYSFMILKLK